MVDYWFSYFRLAILSRSPHLKNTAWLNLFPLDSNVPAYYKAHYSKKRSCRRSDHSDPGVTTWLRRMALSWRVTITVMLFILARVVMPLTNAHQNSRH